MDMELGLGLGLGLGVNPNPKEVKKLTTLGLLQLLQAWISF